METIEWMTCFSVFSVLVCLQPLSILQMHIHFTRRATEDEEEK